MACGQQAPGQSANFFILGLVVRPGAQRGTCAQGKPADIGGYYLPDVSKLDAVMRPSSTLNTVLAAV